MKNFVRIALVIAAAAVLGIACGKKNNVNEATAFPDSIEAGEALATVNGDTIWGVDLLVVAYTNPMGVSLDSLTNPSYNEKFLDQMIDRTLFAQEAQTAGVASPDSVLDNIMEQFSSQFSQGLMDELDARHMKPYDFRREFRRNLLIQNYVNKNIEPSITVSDADCKSYFEEHRAEYAGVDSVRVRHIILLTKKDATPKDLNDRAQFLGKLRSRIENGESFESLARMYSEDGAAKRGGDLGFFARGTMVREFEDMAFTLQKGEMSQVFQTQFGFHLVQCIDKKKAAPPNYDLAKPRIERLLKNQALGTELQNRLKQDRERAIIVRNYKTGA